VSHWIDEIRKPADETRYWSDETHHLTDKIYQWNDFLPNLIIICQV
jgi:hypothetical protein